MVTVRNRTLEIFVGLFMIAGLLALVFLATQVSGLTHVSESGYYRLVAEFDNIGALKQRAPVRIAGVTIGRVESVLLNRKTFRATVNLLIQKSDNNLPIDTEARIQTEGILGANYVALTPGFDQSNLTDGGTIAITQPALILENLIGQMLFKVKEKSANDK
jgi:phospholipid/cholesterol/gamma-HCH transport system substrate-binding protein